MSAPNCFHHNLRRFGSHGDQDTASNATWNRLVTVLTLIITNRKRKYICVNSAKTTQAHVPVSKCRGYYVRRQNIKLTLRGTNQKHLDTYKIKTIIGSRGAPYSIHCKRLTSWKIDVLTKISTKIGFQLRLLDSPPTSRGSLIRMRKPQSEMPSRAMACGRNCNK